MKLDQSTQRRLAELHHRLDLLNAQLAALQASWPVRLLTHRKQKAMLLEADAALAEMSALLGTPYESMRFIYRNPTLPGHPMLWISLQWALGTFNAYRMLEAVMDWRPWLIVLSLFGVLAATIWRVPPLRLALKGKYNDEP